MKKAVMAVMSIVMLGLIVPGGAWELKKVGGPCAYITVPGTITITLIESVPESESAGRDEVTVMFTFTPEDPEARQHYKFPGWSDENRMLTVDGGMKPNGKWIKRMDMAMGSSYGAERKEITSGTCTPVIFEMKATIDEGKANR